ncbi:MAG: oxidoreductase, partial [Gammaproteobacteria bacterium]|nr:oxidoreductase [Gammaproteobacteria bacterium]
MDMSLLPFAAPLTLVLTALLLGFASRRRSPAGAWLAEAGALLCLALTVTSVIWLMVAGAGTSLLIGFAGLGFSARLDPLSVTMLVLVAFIGWVVIRYATTYLVGDSRRESFLAWMALTLAAVLLLVQAGNLPHLVLAWIATSLALHRLLLFNPERSGARRAARKKFIVARIADAALIGAATLLAIRYQTLDIATILWSAGVAPERSGMLWPAALLGVAAVLKSAQFPTHGWLTEVMETPTPVSALLHAGVINAGGFLLIRFADVMVLSPGVLAALVLIGACTALCAGLIVLTQAAVKTSLAWSTIAQMGFM